jgi:spoIIIJ-associated protein
MRVIEKEAKTEEDAINAVLKELGSDNRNMIKNVEVIGEAKPSFLNLRGKRVKVRITVQDDIEKEVNGQIKELLSRMTITLKNIDILENNDKMLKLNLNTDKDSLLIGKRGKTLEAVQYLTNIICNKGKEERIKIVLDVEGYRAKRVLSLQKLAKNLAIKVKESRKDQVLEPMNPFERKIIHSALQDHKDVKTESQGQGIFKKLKISYRRSHSV